LRLGLAGVAVFSQRALPLAAWTNGLELAGLKTDTEMGYLVLETGVNTQYRYCHFPAVDLGVKQSWVVAAHMCTIASHGRSTDRVALKALTTLPRRPGRQNPNQNTLFLPPAWVLKHFQAS
jgi:hypothetical protein